MDEKTIKIIQEHTEYERAVVHLNICALMPGFSWLCHEGSLRSLDEVYDGIQKLHAKIAELEKENKELCIEGDRAEKVE